MFKIKHNNLITIKVIIALTYNEKRYIIRVSKVQRYQNKKNGGIIMNLTIEQEEMVEFIEILKVAERDGYKTYIHKENNYGYILNDDYVLYIRKNWTFMQHCILPL